MLLSVGDLQLVSNLERCKQSIKSIESFLAIADSTEQNANAQKLKKEIILESFAIKTSHRSVSDRESELKEQFLKSEILPYNEKMVHLKRLDSELTTLQRQLNVLKDTMSLPVLSITSKTLLELSKDKFSPILSETKKEDTASSIELSELYSLSPQSSLLKPDLADVKRMLDMETRKRLLLQIKHDLLLQIKNSLLKEKRQWKSRNSNLNAFIEGEFSKAIDGIAKVKAVELEKDSQFEANATKITSQNENAEDNEFAETVDEEDEDEEMKE